MARCTHRGRVVFGGVMAADIIKKKESPIDVRQWTESDSHSIKSYGHDTATQCSQMSWPYLTRSGHDSDLLSQPLSCCGTPWHPNRWIKKVRVLDCTYHQLVQRDGVVTQKFDDEGHGGRQSLLPEDHHLDQIIYGIKCKEKKMQRK